MTSVELKSVSKFFGSVEVLHEVDLSLKAGEFVVFVGPSGCGKSTLVRMIAGLDDITSGDLLINGERMNDVLPARRGMAAALTVLPVVKQAVVAAADRMVADVGMTIRSRKVTSGEAA